MGWDWVLYLVPPIPLLSLTWWYTTNGASIAICWLGYLGQSWAPTWGLSSRTLGWSVGTFSQMFTTQTCSYMSLEPLTWISPKKTRKTRQNMHRQTSSFQGKIFKRHGRLTSKLKETWHTVYENHTNSFRDLITSWITHRTTYEAHRWLSCLTSWSSLDVWLLMHLNFRHCLNTTL